MLDNFLPISDAESLPSRRTVFKLACVCVILHWIYNLSDFHLSGSIWCQFCSGCRQFSPWKHFRSCLINGVSFRFDSTLISSSICSECIHNSSIIFENSVLQNMLFHISYGYSFFPNSFPQCISFLWFGPIKILTFIMVFSNDATGSNFLVVGSTSHLSDSICFN